MIHELMLHERVHETVKRLEAENAELRKKLERYEAKAAEDASYHGSGNHRMTKEELAQMVKRNQDRVARRKQAEQSGLI